MVVGEGAGVVGAGVVPVLVSASSARAVGNIHFPESISGFGW